MKCAIHYVLHSLKLSIIRSTVERERDIIHKCTLPMRNHEWTRMPTQRKSVKDKCVAVRGVVGGTKNASNESNVFSPMLIKFCLMRIDNFPYEDGSSPNVELDEFSDRYRRRLGKSGKKSTQKKKEKRGEISASFERKEKKRKKSKEHHAKWKAVSEPLREGPCFLLISLIHRFLSYMAVCLTNLMVFFPLLESWMAVTPATLAIFWSQYGNGNRQP